MRRTVLLVPLFLAIAITPAFSSALSGCNAQDRQALLSIKSSFSDPDGSLSNWNGSVCCSWTGVQCAGRGSRRRVTKLTLSNSNLGGSLSSAIGNMVNLTYINLGNNALSGTIPSSIGNLKNLVTLDMAYNGGITGSLPSSFGKLSNLYRLRLQSNKITGSVPASFGLLSNLVYLELQDNSLSGKIPDGFVKNTVELALLDLSNNHITGLPKDLSNLKRLGILYLNGNKLDVNSLSSLTTLPFLGELHLDHMNFNSPFPNWVTSLKLRQSDDFLTSLLSLSNNGFTGSLPKNILQWENLEVLDLSYNQLSGSLPANNSFIRRLFLNNNKFTGPILASINAQNSLNYFNVSYNQLTGKIPASVSSFGADSFEGNSGLCGTPLPACK